MIDDFTTGADFGRATASWFGLDLGKVSDVQLQTDLNEPLLATITILLTPDDMTGIGKRMKEIAAGSNGIVEPVAPVDMGELRDFLRKAHGQAQHVFSDESAAARQALDYFNAVVDTELLRRLKSQTKCD